MKQQINSFAIVALGALTAMPLAGWSHTSPGVPTTVRAGDFDSLTQSRSKPIVIADARRASENFHTAAASTAAVAAAATPEIAVTQSGQPTRHTANGWLMSALSAVLVVYQLRRKQRLLNHRMS